jgi:hypothetical protein
VLARGAGLHDLMKGAKGQPATWEMLVDLGYAERQRSADTPGGAKPLNSLT